MICLFIFLFYSLAVCITGGTKPINAGKLNKTLTYEDQVVKLVYEDGDPCPADPELKHRSYLSFVCKSDAGDDSLPVFLSFDEQTCTSYFSWHTSLACEEEVKLTCMESTCGTNSNMSFKFLEGQPLPLVQNSSSCRSSQILFVLTCSPGMNNTWKILVHMVSQVKTSTLQNNSSVEPIHLLFCTAQKEAIGHLLGNRWLRSSNTTGQQTLSQVEDG